MVQFQVCHFSNRGRDLQSAFHSESWAAGENHVVFPSHFIKANHVFGKGVRKCLDGYPSMTHPKIKSHILVIYPMNNPILYYPLPISSFNPPYALCIRFKVTISIHFQRPTVLWINLENGLDVICGRALLCTSRMWQLHLGTQTWRASTPYHPWCRFWPQRLVYITGCFVRTGGIKDG